METNRNRKLKRRGKLRVIQITGLRGILSAGFVVVCLAAGFVGFPSFVLYKAWNFIAGYTSIMPAIGIMQGFLLWGIIATMYLIINERNKYFVAFEPKTVSGKNIREIIEEIKSQSGELSDTEKLQKQTEIDTKQNEENAEDKI